MAVHQRKMSVGSGHQVEVSTVEIQNTFNSMPWTRILEMLVIVKVLVNLRNIIRDRVVFAQTASGMVRKEMTCGVPQGSVLGFLPWNITFDDILKEAVLLGVSIICYADNPLVVTVEDDIPMLEWKVNTTLKAMTRWIESAKLSLAVTKTEVVLFTYPSFRLKGEQIRLCTTLKYLGL